MDMLAAAWLLIGLASALWVSVHQARYLHGQQWVMRLAWPLWSIMAGPLGIVSYWLAYRRPVIRHGRMVMWDRPLWLQGLVATVSAVGFGGALMIITGWVMTFVGLPLWPNHLPGGLILLGSPMIWAMIGAYVVAVGMSWLLYQTSMIAMFHGQPYRRALGTALPVVLASMTSVSLAMFPGMWWLMMANLPMMPSEESILWFGVMAWTVMIQGYAYDARLRLARRQRAVRRAPSICLYFRGERLPSHTMTVNKALLTLGTRTRARVLPGECTRRREGRPHATDCCRPVNH